MKMLQIQIVLLHEYSLFWHEQIVHMDSSCCLNTFTNILRVRNNLGYSQLAHSFTICFICDYVFDSTTIAHSLLLRGGRFIHDLLSLSTNVALTRHRSFTLGIMVFKPGCLPSLRSVRKESYSRDQECWIMTMISGGGRLALPFGFAFGSLRKGSSFHSRIF